MGMIYKFKKNILYLLLIICCNDSMKNNEQIKSKISPDNFITNPKITISKKNIISLKTSANFLEKNESEDTKLIGNVIADFYNDLGEHTSILNSDSAIINETDNSFKAFGNVKVISDSGFILTTQTIYWDRNYNKVISEDSVRFTTEKNDTLYGVGFESDIDLSNWKILKPTGVTYRIN